MQKYIFNLKNWYEKQIRLLFRVPKKEEPDKHNFIFSS